MFFGHTYTYREEPIFQAIIAMKKNKEPTAKSDHGSVKKEYVHPPIKKTAPAMTHKPATLRGVSCFPGLDFNFFSHSNSVIPAFPHSGHSVSFTDLLSW
jgi:hypothetical protein